MEKGTIFQSYNSRSGSWVKFKIKPNGMATIVSVKKNWKKIPYMGVRIK